MDQKEYDILNSFAYIQNCHKFLNIYERIIIQVVSSHKNCFVSFSTLAKEAGMCKRQAVNCVNSLEEKQILQIQRLPREKGKQQETNRIEINREKVKESLILNGVPEGKIRGSACDALGVVHTVHHPSAYSAPRSACDALGVVHTVHPKVLKIKVLNESTKTKEEAKLSPIKIYDSTLSEEVFRAWNKVVTEKGILDIETNLTDKAVAYINETSRLYLKDIDSWRTLFYSIYESKLLTGQCKPKDGHDQSFKAFFLWVIQPKNAKEIINGKYFDKKEKIEVKTKEEEEFDKIFRNGIANSFSRTIIPKKKIDK